MKTRPDGHRHNRSTEELRAEFERVISRELQWLQAAAEAASAGRDLPPRN